MKKIAILGNCQIYALQNYLSVNESFRNNWEILSIPPVFEITDGASILSLMTGIDCIASQPLHSYVGGVDMAMESLRVLCGDCIGFPNVYFDGYNPELFYLKINGRLLRCPLFGGIDYTLANILFSYISGHTVAQCVDAWYSQGTLEGSHPGDGGFARKNVDVSINELANREAHCDIKSASFVQENAFCARIFYTMNHPSMAVMNHVTSQLFERLGLVGYVDQVADLFSHTAMPIISTVKDVFGFENDLQFKIAGHFYAPHYVIAEYYSWFDGFSHDQLKAGLADQFKVNPLLESILTA